MAQNMLDNFNMDKNTDLENLHIKMAQVMRVYGLIICFMGLVNFFGLIREDIRDIGRITLCMEKESSLPSAEKNMMVFITMMKNMVTENTHFLMARNTWDFSKMENKMDMAITILMIEKDNSSVYGAKEKD